MVSEGGTKHDYRLDFATQAEAEQPLPRMAGAMWTKIGFEWRLEWRLI